GSARVGPLEVVVALGTAVAAVAGTIGADTRWLPAHGRIIVNRGEIPDGISYATAPSAGWHNVPVLAELIMRGLTSAAGDRGLLLLQVIAVAAALAILGWELRRAGAEDLGGALVLLVIVVGALPVLLIVRSQLFSLLLLPAAAIALLVLAIRARPALWETIALAGLAVLTVKAARSGIWLLFFAAAPAARRLHLEPGRERRIAVVALPVALALAVFGLVR